MESATGAAYRTHHSVDNLLVRVSLRAVGSPADSASASPREVVSEFAWQQKVFGPAELLAYAALGSGGSGSSDDSNDALHLEYAADVQKLVASTVGGLDALLRVPPCGVILYTITDRDTQLPLQELARNFLMDAPASAPAIVIDAAGAPPADGGAGAAAASGSSSSSTPAFRASPPSAPIAPTALLSHPHASFVSKLLNPHHASVLPGHVGSRVLRQGAGTASVMFIMAAMPIYAPSSGGSAPPPSASALASSSTGAGAPMLQLTGWSSHPLAALRWLPNAHGAEGGLLDACPGFATPAIYDRTAIMALARSLTGEQPTSGSAAVHALMLIDAALGSGRNGGTLRLRALPSPTLPLPTSTASISATLIARSASAPSSSSSNFSAAAAAADYEREAGNLAIALEAHRFVAPGGVQWELIVENGDDSAAAFAAEEDASIAAQDAADAQAVVRGVRQVGSDFFSSLPHALAPNATLRASVYVEIVAAARFDGPDNMFVTYELVLPPGSGWSLLPEDDTPSGSASSSAAYKILDAPLAVKGVTQVSRALRRPWAFGGSRNWGRGGGGVAAAASTPRQVSSPFFGATSDRSVSSPFFGQGNGNEGSDRSGSWEGEGHTSHLASVEGGASQPYVPVAHLSFPFAAHIAFTPSACCNPVGPAPPLLHLAVYSLDSWGRHRAEGYTTVPLPAVPTGGVAAWGTAAAEGTTSDAVAQCWAPALGDSEAAQADFFLGGATRLVNTETRHADEWRWAEGSAGPGGEGKEEDGGAGSYSVASAAQGARERSLVLSGSTVATGEVALRFNVLRQAARRAAHGGHGGAGAPHHADAVAAASALAATIAKRRGAKTVEEIIAEAKAVRRSSRTGSVGSVGSAALPPPPAPAV